MRCFIVVALNLHRLNLEAVYGVYRVRSEAEKVQQEYRAKEKYYTIEIIETYLR